MKSFAKMTLAVLAALLLGVGAGFLFHWNVPAERSASSALLSGKPVRLLIPALGLDAPIEDMGITASGEMESPKEPRVVGWYSKGTTPGQVGSAVLAGHYGWKDNIPATFDKLSILKPGDTIIVRDDQGKNISFVVTGSKMYDRKANTAEVFFSEKGAHLNLITCGGVWDKAQESYESRLVVFTDLAQ